MKFIGFLILSGFLALSSQAAPLTSCVWQTSPNAVRLLVATNSVSTPRLADCKGVIQRYVDAVNSDADLRKMMSGNTLPIPAESVYSIFTGNSTTQADKPRFVINANEFNQISDPREFVMSEMVSKLTESGADIYVLPVAADLAAGTNAANFRAGIAQAFDAMLSLGGEDINPALYGQQIKLAIANDVHPSRDAHEIQIQKDYIAKSKGVFYAICRGHQLAAVSQGQKLYQDIYTGDSYSVIGHTSTPHGGGAWHSITLSPTSIFLKWASYDIINGVPTMWVNSFHHEAIAYPLRAPLRGTKALTVTAYEQDDLSQDSHRIIEAVESLDGRYISMQFHPEGMDNDLHGNGKKILNGMVAHAGEIRTQ
jgi:gamma-glutamyl-gamma-aminobutyrate hydrolase PuuD